MHRQKFFDLIMKYAILNICNTLDKYKSKCSTDVSEVSEKFAVCCFLPKFDKLTFIAFVRRVANLLPCTLIYWKTNEDIELLAVVAIYAYNRSYCYIVLYISLCSPVKKFRE